MSDNMTINRLRFGFHRSDNRFQNSVPVLALIKISPEAPGVWAKDLINLIPIYCHYWDC